MSSQASLDQIQELYIAYYGRPADAAGLTYWASALDSNGGNLSGIINAFATSAESTALYGADTTPTSIVTAIYENVLHRAPDSTGLAYYTNALSTGQITAGNLAIAVTNGVQGADVTMLQNEVAVANQFTAQATTYGGATAADIGRTLLSQVSVDSTAQTALLAQVTSYVNAASAATTTPTEFAGQITNGVLTTPSMVQEYATSTTPVTTTTTTTTTTSSGNGSGSSGSSGGGGSPAPTSVSGTIASMFSGGQVISSITTGIAVTVTDGATVAQIQAIETADATGTITYPLLDTWANISNSANSAIVAGASSYTISDIGVGTVVSVAQAGVLTHANNYIGGANTYSLTDTIANITAPANSTVVAGATGYALADTLAHLDNPANTATVTAATGYALTDTAGALGALSVANAGVVAHATDASSYTYTLSDTIGHLLPSGSLATVVANGMNIAVTDVASVAQIQSIQAVDSTGTLTYTLSDTLAHLDASGNSSVVTSHSYALTDSAALWVLTAANATVAQGATDFTSGGYSYTISDTAGAILGASSGVLSAATVVELSSSATVSVANADTLAALNGFSLNGNALTLSDTVANLTGHTTDGGATSYGVVDTVENILGDSSGIVTAAGAITMNVDNTASGTLTTNAAALNINGAAALTLTLAAPAAETVNASTLTGALNLTDSGFGDTISTGSGTTTITESSTANADNITLLSGHTAVNTLILSAQNVATDIVNNFVLNQDVITSGTPLTAGSELSAASGIVANGNYASASLFIAAAQAATGVAGDTIAWIDQANNNTYVAAFNGSTAGSAHIVELVGVQATTVGGTGAGHVLIA